MKIAKVALPVVALTVLFSAYACHHLDQVTVATADAGALPETTAILKQMKLNHTRMAATVLRHHALPGNAE